jgi:acetylornithine deacetylase/succinyl-diaminopimelate desuccinylase-like protein
VVKNKIKEMAESELFKEISNFMDENMKLVVNEIKTISLIPSPSYEEDLKAEYLKKRFEELDLHNIKVDQLKNVIGVINGESDANFIICAHIDTVFDKVTPLIMKEEAGKLYCPSIGDNSTSVAGMLILAEALKSTDYVPPCNLVFVANSCEEGLGDLKGIKHLLGNITNVKGMISIDGTMDKLVNEGIGSRRLKVEVNAAGGHSWGNFGNSSAIHAICGAISKISRIEVPNDPKTSFNIGTISGGTSVNTIAESAQMLVDIRSMDGDLLRSTEKKIRELIDDAMDEHKTSSIIEVVGDRPSGKLLEDHFMVQSVLESARLFDVQMDLNPSSTDSNIPLSMGIPSVTYGIYMGDGAHTIKEYIEPGSLKKGLPILALSVLSILDKIGKI